MLFNNKKNKKNDFLFDIIKYFYISSEWSLYILEVKQILKYMCKILKEHRTFWKSILGKLQSSPGEKKVENKSEELDVIYADYGGYAGFVEHCLRILLERIELEGYVPSEDRPILNELIETGKLPAKYQHKFAEIVGLYPESITHKVAV